ncbi:hypothetical protein [Pseudomonas sp. NPDC099000]|uniref:hypothetical protein n=1 Tax=Pseudomonas sp. NPDC099000 TaxID=3364488 RepID=UPI00383A39CC
MPRRHRGAGMAATARAMAKASGWPGDRPGRIHGAGRVCSAIAGRGWAIGAAGIESEADCRA